MTLEEVLHQGIKSGVHKHWRYQKSLLKVKPEYLFTVATADELTKGFDNVSGMDLGINLEWPVHEISSSARFSLVGLHELFSTPREFIFRDGKVDIYVNYEVAKESYVIELKSFNPNSTEIKKELNRLSEFLLIYEGETTIKSCFLSFPTEISKKGWIQEQLDALKITNKLSFAIAEEYMETGEEPEDGMPSFYSNVITIRHTTTKIG